VPQWREAPTLWIKSLIGSRASLGPNLLSLLGTVPLNLWSFRSQSGRYNELYCLGKFFIGIGLKIFQLPSWWPFMIVFHLHFYSLFNYGVCCLWEFHTGKLRSCKSLWLYRASWYKCSRFIKWCTYLSVLESTTTHEGWNFNSGNYLFTTDTK